MLISSEKEMELFASAFVLNLAKTESAATVVALHGDLGAGKTTFVRFVAAALAIKDKVTSPTFVIMKQYKFNCVPCKEARDCVWGALLAAGNDGAEEGTVLHKPCKMIHIDAYRLGDAGELNVLGWRELAGDSQNLIFIEWPERVSEILPENTVHLYLSCLDENTREVKID